MSEAEAKKLSGTIDYLCSAASGKRARAFAKPIRDWERSGRQRLDHDMQVALQALRPIIIDTSWNTILGQAVARRFAILFSDARGRHPQSNWGTERLAAVIITASGGAYAAIDAQDPIARAWLELVVAEQRINECEEIAALLGLSTFANILAGMDVLHFVDSTAAQGILINGYSKSRVLTVVASACWTVEINNFIIT